MPNLHGIINVDCAGIFCADIQRLAAAVPPGMLAYEALLATPYKRIKQLSNGNAIVVNCDDGSYEVTLCTSEETATRIPNEVATVVFSRVTIYLRLSSGCLTVGDIGFLLKTREVLLQETNHEDASRIVTAIVPPGVYEISLATYSRRATAADQAYSRLEFSEDDHVEWTQLFRDGLTAPNETREKLLAQRRALEAQAVRTILGLELLIMGPTDWPDSYQPPECDVEMPSEQVASVFAQGRRKKRMT